MKKSVLNHSLNQLNIFCSGCGLCEGVCPVGAISMKVSQEGFYRPQHTSNICINCGICHDNCSGIKNGKWYSLENCKKIVYGYSRNSSIRRESASGGLVTEILAYLLETRKIDYAIVAGNYNGNHECSYAIAENREELIRYSGSNYCPVPIGKAIKEIKNRKGYAAVVCLPCLADALKNYQKSSSGHKIKYIFSLICNHTPSFLGTDNIIRKHNISGKAEKIKYRGDGWLGYFRFYSVGKKVQKVAFEKYYKDLMEKRYFQHRCIICNDHFGKGADASFGDPDFLKQFKTRRSQAGSTMVIINSLEILDILNNMKGENRIYFTDKLDNKDIIRWKEHFIELRKKRLVERKRLVKNHFVYDRIIPALYRKIKKILIYFETIETIYIKKILSCKMHFSRPNNEKINFYRTNFINKTNKDFVDAAIRKDDNKYELLYRELTVKNEIPVKFNDEYLRKRLALRVIKELLNIKRVGKQKIFEVGFGHGELLLSLNKMGHITGGSDSSIERANYLKSTMKNIRDQSIEKLNPIKEKYDVVICCEVLEHVFDLEVALMKINELLNENGAFLGTVPYLNKREYVSHVRVFNKTNLLQALVNSGFNVNSIILMPNMMKGKEDILFFWAFKGENYLWKSYLK